MYLGTYTLKDQNISRGVSCIPSTCSVASEYKPELRLRALSETCTFASSRPAVLHLGFTSDSKELFKRRPGDIEYKQERRQLSVRNFRYIGQSINLPSINEMFCAEASTLAQSAAGTYSSLDTIGIYPSPFLDFPRSTTICFRFTLCCYELFWYRRPPHLRYWTMQLESQLGHTTQDFSFRKHNLMREVTRTLGLNLWAQ